LFCPHPSLTVDPKCDHLHTVRQPESNQKEINLQFVVQASPAVRAAERPPLIHLSWPHSLKNKILNRSRLANCVSSSESSAVTRSNTHTIGGKGVAKALMASEMPATAKARTSRFLENNPYSVLAVAGKGVAKALMASEMPATAKARTSRFLENNSYSVLAVAISGPVMRVAVATPSFMGAHGASVSLMGDDRVQMAATEEVPYLFPKFL
jgi:uncharacterized protein YbjT (DUF2867 family)